MRLHLLHDEKIINRTIDLFEKVYPGENKYIILLRDKAISAKFVQKKNENVYFYRYDTEEFWEAIGDVMVYDSIIIHYLSIYTAKFINRIKHPNIYWIEWGGDLYDTFLAYKGYRLYEDDKLICNVSHENIPYCVYKFLKYFQKKRLLKILHQAVRKVKYFVPDSMYDEYPLLLTYYPEFSHLEYREFFYYPIDEILGPQLINKTCEGNSIIIGNSCSFTGNHLTVLQNLKDLSIENKIIVPLSYGGNTKYRDMIVKYGNQSFGNKFIPVKDFLPLNEYNKILLSASIFIYGNLRQEAVGNILIALYLGGKVFLNSRNPLLEFYKSQGLRIFSTDELSKESLQVRLSAEDILKNKSIMMEKYSLSRLLSLVNQNF